MPFDQSTRNRLARFVADARALLTEEFTRQLQQEYGMDPDTGDVADLERLAHLDDARRQTAQILRSTMLHYLAGDMGDEGRAARQARQRVLDRIVREQAFTVLNRLCALRLAEARGIIIESVAAGYGSQGFQLYGHLAGSGLGETGDAYRSYLFSVFDELAVDLAVLFDRFSPQGRLFPRNSVLLELLDLVNDPELESLWSEDETIGWIYQYFNSQEERRQMRAASQAPRNSRELAVRNQFFTPRYVVEFLTDNTLGRIWYEMTKGQTSLVDACRYFVRRPFEIFLDEGEDAPIQADRDDGADLNQGELLNQPVYIPHRPLKDPRTILMLDPACGSMHFGLYAFDLYEAIYAEAWELEERHGYNALLRSDGLLPLHETYADKESYLRDVPRLIIERNIHGIDIDLRAVQIAGLSLWLRAQRSWQQQGLGAAERSVIRKSNIVCAEPMPGDQAQLNDFLQGLREERLESLIRRVLDVPKDQRVRATPSMADALCELVSTVWHEMELAGEAGSLLKIEENLATAIDHARDEWERMPLFRVETFRLTEAGEQEANVTYPSMIPGEEADFWDRAEALVLAALQEYAEHAQHEHGYTRRLFAADAARGFSFIDLYRKAYQVVLMNPPFGQYTRRTLGYAKDNYKNGSNDLYAAFVLRGEDVCVSGGYVGVISSRLGFYLDGLQAWREHFMGNHSSVTVIADLGYGVLDAVVETAAYVICIDKAVNEFLAISALSGLDKSVVVQTACQDTVEGQLSSSTHVSYQDLLRSLPGAVLAYWLPVEFVTHVKDFSRVSDSDVDIYSGLQTDNDFRFLRLWWECPIHLQYVRWFPFAKGGEYQPYADDLHLVVEWTNDGSQMKSFVAGLYRNWSRHIKNTDTYFVPGLTYTERTTSDISIRAFPQDAIFSVSGPVIQSKHTDDLYVAWGLFTSRIGRAFVEMAVGSGDSSRAGTAARHYRTGILKDAFWPQLSSEQLRLVRKKLNELYRLNLSKSLLDETHRLYAPRLLLDSSSIGATLRERRSTELRHFEKATYASHTIDAIMASAFRTSLHDVEELGSTHPLDDANCQSEISERLLHELLSMSDEQLRTHALESDVNSRTATKKTYYYSRRLELIAAITRLRFETLVEFIDQFHYASGEELADQTSTLILMGVGLVYGVWDIRYCVGNLTIINDSKPFDSLPKCSPGMLQDKVGLPALSSNMPEDYPLRISWPGILVADLGHREDIVARVREALAVIWPDNHETIEAEACEILGVDSLRTFFANPNKFFDDHLKRYSKSRRYAPIYWPLSTPSGSYTLWLYYHRISDQILYTCINDFVDPKLNDVSGQVADLRRKSDRTREDERDLERLSDLELELQEFRAELLRIAQFWRPNLNDGVQITAAPLWSLFRHRSWQRRLRNAWEKLEAGDYDWSHLAMSIWPERVVPKCTEDRSLAIAHDVEDLFWVEDDVDGWRSLRSPDEEIALQKQRLAERYDPTRREQILGALHNLAAGPARGVSGHQVAQHLAEGNWDDTEAARLFWPQRVAETCIADPFFAARAGLSMPEKRTKAALKRWSKQLVEAGCPDLADALLALLADDVAFEQLLADLEAGRHDGSPLTLALWPDRVLERCLDDVEVAEALGLRRYVWVNDFSGAMRRRQRQSQEVQTEIKRRQAM